MMMIPAVGMAHQGIETAWPGPNDRFVARARLAYDPPVDAEVSFQPTGKRVRVPVGTTILEAARRVGLPVASGCAAHGLCARCGVTILAGADSVSTQTPEEAQCKQVNRIDPEQRLSCMVEISGDVEITATYW